MSDPDSDSYNLACSRCVRPAIMSFACRLNDVCVVNLVRQDARSGCTVLKRYQCLSYRWSFAFQSLGHKSSSIILAKDRRASARLAFQLHQRMGLLLLQSFFNPYLLFVQLVLFIVQQDVGFDVWECVAVFAPLPSS